MTRNTLRKSKARRYLAGHRKRAAEKKERAGYLGGVESGRVRERERLTRFVHLPTNNDPILLNKKPGHPRLVVALNMPNSPMHRLETLHMPTAEFLSELHVETFGNQHVAWYGWKLDRWGY